MNIQSYASHRGQRLNIYMGMMSTLYDCVNKMVLDIQVDEFKVSERKLAKAHLEVTKENFR